MVLALIFFFILKGRVFKRDVFFDAVSKVLMRLATRFPCRFFILPKLALDRTYPCWKK